MPSARMIDRLAPLFTVDVVRDLDPSIFEGLKVEGSLIDVIIENSELNEAEVAYLRAVPQTLREGARALIVQAVTMGKAVHVQYAPAYEFGLHLWDYGEAVSVHLEGPYPDDFERPNFANE